LYRYVEVSWRPPSKNADRVHHYKLMMATNTGVVKEVCQGKYERFKVGRYKSNAVDPQLESAWFQPLNLSSESCFKNLLSNSTYCNATPR
jgi:hypothetical protein